MRVSLSWKMALGFGIIAAALIFVTGYTYTALDAVSTTVTTTLAADVATIDKARGLHILLNEEERNAQKFLVTRDPAYLRIYGRTRMLTIDRLDSLETDLNDSLEFATLAELRRVHSWLDDAIPARTARPHLRNGQIMDSLDIAHNGLDRLVAINQHAVAGAAGIAEEHTTATLEKIIVLLAGVTALTIVMAFFITLAVARPLARLRRSTERIARGEFHTIPMRAHDDFGMLVRSFNTMSERLRRIDEYKADVMQQISHELRTPLQAMHAAYYMLAEQIAGPLNERQRSLLTTIRDNVDSLSAFSNQFLDLAKIEAGMMQFRREPVDLLSVITPVISTARLIAAQKDINIGLAAQAVPRVNADPEKVVTVLNNLLSNAVKFTPTGGNITVTLSPCEDGARIAVKDSGIGIDPEDVPRLFTKFFQARNVTQINVKGTGVGLALVKAIVDGHGGKVFAASVVGQGSTFTVELPTELHTPVTAGTTVQHRSI
jgi:two-component system, NtrC family, sensor histidine kinase GlrK